jgi:hypothetical protein
MPPTYRHVLPLLAAILGACTTAPTALAPVAATAVSGTLKPATNSSLQRVAFSRIAEFSDLALRSGVSATRADCDTVREAVWVDSKAFGSECLRYWKAGFGDGPARRAIVFFHGDVWLGTQTSPTYLQLNEEKQQAIADEWAKKLGVPYIHFARPGTHGSSGDHMQRRRRAESELITLALDELKKRYGIFEWVVTGQSGGGHVTASLLVHRSDIVCAVPASSVSSPRMRWILLGRSTDATGYHDSYEPTEFLVKKGQHPKLRIFVVGSLEDKNTPWSTQTLLTGRANAVGLQAIELTGQGSGSQQHGMADSGRSVAGWCAQGLTDDQIREKAKAGLAG